MNTMQNRITIFRRLLGYSGGVLFVVLSLIPLAQWLLYKPLGIRFENLVTTLGSLGQISGLVGMALFSLTLILSGRFKLLEPLFGGLGRMYAIHRWGGAFAFALLLLHPVLLAFRLVPSSVVSAALFFVPSADWAMNFGILSLAGMIGIMLITIFARMRYQLLKFSHSLFGFFFLLGGLHSILVSSDISRHLAMRYYLVALASVALSAYVYRTILGRFTVPKYDYVISDVQSLGAGVVELTLEPATKRMKYRVGQFVFIEFKSPHFSSEPHPFSISSPDARQLKIAVKALGDFTQKMSELKAGTWARVEGPYGSFSFHSGRHEKQVWIAGGIGITPFLSMARYLKNNPQPNLHIDLYYCGKNENELVFLRELQEIAERCPNLRVWPTLSEQHGRLTARQIAEHAKEISATDVFLCGPQGMMANLKKQFLELDTPRLNIHTEEFQLL